jgi:uncharacterized phiE125 gp8 family phage protein
MTLKLITPADGELITLAEAKRFMRVDHTDDDELIEELIKGARARIEGPGPLNAVFLTQTWDLVLDKFPGSEIMIPLAPVQHVEEVVYFDEDGLEQTVDGSNYYLDDVSRPPYLLTVGDFSWPSTLDTANALRVRFVAGFPPGGSGASGENDIAANLPATVRIAAQQLVSHWYERRDLIADAAVFVVPEFVWTLLNRYRMFI